MYKKLSMMVAAVFAAGSLLSAPALAAPNDQNASSEKQEAIKREGNKKQQEKGTEKQKEKNGHIQQLKSIDKQLDKIEEKLQSYKSKLPVCKKN